MDSNSHIIHNFKPNALDLTQSIPSTKSSSMEPLNKNIFFIQRSNRRAYTDNFASDYLYQSSKTWCNSQRDYCPLVIALVSIVILITLLLIIYLCIKTSFECTCIRRFTLCLRNKFARTTTSSAPSVRPDQPRRSNIETLAALRNPTVSNASRSAFRNITRQLNQHDRNIWFTDSYCKSTPPPPTYEESQQNIISHKSTAFQSANVNNAFSIESIHNQAELPPMPVFQNYRYLSLTTSPSTRAQLSHLSNLSRRLLDENQLSIDMPSHLVRQGTLNINNDEVPPDYETVVKNAHDISSISHQISSIEMLI